MRAQVAGGIEPSCLQRCHRPIMPTLQIDPHWAASSLPGLRLCAGIDTVVLSSLRESLAAFGQRFVQRLFTAHEQAVVAESVDGGVERLAARFAAKEAAIKAFGLSEVGVDWRQIEVFRLPSGAPELRLHGRALAHAHALGVRSMTVSLSHDGDQACALVVAVAADPTSPDCSNPD
jgi:holo-[acyl-carrier protein] synthase